ncbi:NIF family HAD-type phosphatase [Alphaproteobacteria bacterium]|nr:NIF family HAD-type phosphatase [Alphaproteobacteria bacterium]
MKAVLFGSIGTLIETSDIQRKSFNHAFKREGLNWYWSRKTYSKLLKKSGGIRRIEDFARQNGESVNAKKIWKSKTDIFNKIIFSNNIGARRGVLKIFKYAKKNNIDIGLVSSTSKKNINTIFQVLDGQIKREEFSFIGNKNLVSEPKPSPDIYFKALEIMNLDKKDCVAIEDSTESANSAIKAGIQCIAFPGIYHSDEDFEFCKLKLNKLDISIFK